MKIPENWSANSPCVVCGIGDGDDGMTCLHHLYTRKARPDLQIKDWNLIPVCLRHHNQFHDKGTFYMAEKYNEVSLWLKHNGWEYDDFFNKYYHPKANRNNAYKN